MALAPIDWPLSNQTAWRAYEGLKFAWPCLQMARLTYEKPDNQLRKSMNLRFLCVVLLERIGLEADRQTGI